MLQYIDILGELSFSYNFFVHFFLYVDSDIDVQRLNQKRNIFFRAGVAKSVTGDRDVIVTCNILE